jgi:hypothetical protein
MPEPLIIVAQRLADVLDRENDALRVMDLIRAATLLPEKTAAMADLTGFGEHTFELPNPALVATAKRLDSLASENRRLLKRALVAQQRVIGIVVRAVAAAALAPSYGAKGRQARQSGPMALSTRA